MILRLWVRVPRRAFFLLFCDSTHMKKQLPYFVHCDVSFSQRTWSLSSLLPRLPYPKDPSPACLPTFTLLTHKSHHASTSHYHSNIICLPSSPTYKKEKRVSSRPFVTRFLFFPQVFSHHHLSSPKISTQCPISSPSIHNPNPTKDDPVHYPAR